MESIIRAAAIYLILIFLFRVAGRRTLSKMTSFDLVLVLIISETTQHALLGEDYSFTNAFLVMMTLLSLDIILAMVKGKSSWIEKVIDGAPTILIQFGHIDQSALKFARVEISEILTTARRERGIFRLEDIEHAILEADGHISIIEKRSLVKLGPPAPGGVEEGGS